MLAPSTLLFNGHIFSGRKDQEFVPAVLIAQGRVLGLGTREQMEAGAGPTTTFLDLEGRWVYPGLIDAHLHFEQFSHSLDQFDCETADLQTCLSLIHQRAQQTKPGDWIRGHGWNQNQWHRFGIADDLDHVAPHHPVYLTAKSLHAAWVNSRALAEAGINASTPDPEGGSIQRDANGNPTGILFESAMEFVSNRIPRPDADALAKLMLKAQDVLWRFGLTGIHDFDGARCLQALQILRQQRLLGLRVVKNIPVRYLAQAAALGLRSHFGDAWLRLGNVKVFADGALGPRTAAMLEPYQEQPENRGMLLVDSEELLEIGRKASDAGLALTVHAIGDRANHEVLNAFEHLRKYENQTGITGLRHRIEHLQLLHPNDIPRPAQLDILASMQPLHATSDMLSADRYWGDRVATAYAWNALESNAARLVFGSDAPVESPNPFLGIHAAATRRRLNGDPGPAGWTPSQRIRIQSALHAYTQGAAYAAGLEDQQGWLGAGTLADLIVLDQELLQLDPHTIASIQPRATMVNGEWMWRSF